MRKIKNTYQKEIIPKIKQIFGYKNNLEVPKLVKVSINMGLGSANDNPKILESLSNDLAMITGQKPSYRMAKKAIAGFKIRKGNKIGLSVTLRGQMMGDFLERLINITLPRIRDFRGLKPDSFDGHGNYSIGFPDQAVFTEIDYDKLEVPHGLEVTIVTSAKNDKVAKELLTLLGFPFKSTLVKNRS